MRLHTTKRGRHPKRNLWAAVAGVLCLALAAVALASSVAAQNAPPPAGSITALIPKDFIHRGRSAPMEAKKGAAVQWEDLIRTEQGGRVRVTLTDGSVLNIGSQSQLKIVQQDAASEQSQLELVYGKVRADVIKRTRPDGEFTIRTPTAVAGVIGTGEYLEATPTETVVIALNGIVAVSSNNPTISGQVFLKPGQKTRVLHNQPPGPPEDATDEELGNAQGETSSLPAPSLRPATAQPGASLAAVLSGIDFTGITSLTFSHDGLAATLGAGTEAGLGVTVTVAEDVPPGRYSFTVWAGAESVGEGRFIVAAPGEGSASLRALDVHLPPDPVITGEWYYDPQQPPLPLLTGSLDVAQGALLRLSGMESTSADGHPIAEFDWDIPGTSIRGTGPTFELDTWQLQRGSYHLRLRAVDDDGHGARTELDLTVRDLPNPDELIANCLVAGYEAQGVNTFMSCFSVDFRGYPVLYESIRTFLQDASEVRVYSRIDNRQILRDDANYQVTFEVTFSTDAAPTIPQPRTEQLTLRMHLYREPDSEQWLITDFSSSVGGASVLSGTGVAPAISVAPPSIAFGNVLVGATSGAQTVTISNTGSADLTVSSISLGGSSTFSLAGLPLLPATIAPSGSVTFNVTFAPLAGGAAGNTVSIASDAGGASVLLSGTGVAPAIQVSPTSHNFNIVRVGQTSPAQTFTITNTGSAPLTVNSISLSGPGSGAFALTLPTLPAVIAPAATTSFSATFTPSAALPFAATVTVASDAGSPTVSLSGTGGIGVPSLGGNSLNFGNVLVGTTSPAQTVTISNVGNADLVVSSITLSGSAGFALSLPALPTIIPPSGSTTFDVTFAPLATGLANNTITITTDNGSPTVSLSGTGIAPAISVAPPSIAFGSVLVGSTSGPETVTISNTGSADLTVSSISLGGAAGFALSLPGLPAVIAPSNSITFDVTFAPLAVGAAGDTVSIASDAGPASVTLSGAGIAPAISVAPPSIAFGNVLVGSTSGPQTVTISNTGSADLTVSSITLGGAAGFALSLPGLPAVIAPSNSITFDVTFSPAATGLVGDTVTVVSDAGSPTVTLSGTGIAPAISVAPPSIAFGSVLVGSTSGPETVTISNTGSADLTVSSITLGSTAGFALSLPGLPAVIAPSNSITFDVTFSPAATGLVGDTVSISSDAGGASVLLSGTGIAPAISVAPPSIAFGNVLVGSTSGPETVTITNTGSADLTVSSITLGSAAGFALSLPGLPAVIAPSNSITFDVTFAPLAVGAAGDTVSIASDAGGASVLLSGTGIAPAISVAPPSIAFGNVLVGSTSGPQTVTISNTGSADLTVSSISLGGAAGFALSLPGLPAVIAPSNSITFDVTFSPAATGLVGDTVTVVSDAGSPTVTLSGTGIAPAISVAPPSIAFGSVLVGSTSGPETVTISNTGSADLTVSSITLGSAAGFALSLPGLPAVIAPSNSITFDVTFAPLAVGAAGDTVSIASDAGGASVLLSGTGIAPAISVAPPSIAFGNVLVGSTSGPQTVTISNTGSADLTVSSISLGGAAGFALSLPGLPAVIAPSNSITFDVTFAPAGTGLVGDTVTIMSDAGSPTVAVSGTGIQGALDVNPTSVSFGNIPLGSSGSATVTLTNTGTATITLSSITLTSGAGVGFAVDTTGTALTLAPTQSTTFAVSFTPNTACTAVTGQVGIVSDAPGAPHTVALAGTGVQPALTLSAASIDFGTVNVGSSFSASVALTNSGCSTLAIASINLTGGSSGFAVDTAATSFSLAPSASTSFSVTFAPLAGGAVADSVSIASDAPTSPDSVSLAGTGQLVASINVSPTSINFGDVVACDPSVATCGPQNTATVTLIVTNTGAAILNLTSISTNSAACPGTFGFSGISPSGASLSSGANISFDVTFTPTANGACTGSLTITSNAASSPTTVSLSGNGVNSIAFTVQVQNADGTANSPSNPLLVVQGAGATATVLAIDLPGSPQGRVNIALQGILPSGLTVQCVVLAGSNLCDSATTGHVFLNKPQPDRIGFSFAAGLTSPPGTYALQVTANGVGTTQVTTVYIQIVPPSSPGPAFVALAKASGSSGKIGKRAGSRRGRGRDREPEPTGEPGEAVPADLDIVAAQVQLEPGQPQAGERVRVLVPVRNLGAGPAENVTLALAIPAWNLRAEQTLSLAGHEGALVEFAFDVPAGFVGGPVSARIVADPEHRVADANRTNNRAQVANLMPAGTGGSAAVISTQGAAEFGWGDCVSFRLNGAAPADCGEGGDFQLRADMGRLTLSADAVRDLGPGPLTGSASGAPGNGSRAAVQVGHVYEISGGARRAQVRVVRVKQSSTRKPGSGKAGGRGVPAVFDGPRVNDPFQLPDRNRVRRPTTIQVQVELEWVILP